MKILTTIFFILSTLILLMMISITLTIYPDLPGRIPLNRYSDGSIGASAGKSSVYIMAFLYLGIFLTGIYVFRSSKKINFKCKAEFEKKVSKENKEVIYTLIKQSLGCLIFLLGLIIFYIQIALLLLSKGKMNSFNYLPLALSFALFIFSAIFYNKIINYKANRILMKSEKGD